MPIHSVGIIGYGNFGAFVHVLLKRFAPQVAVKICAPEKKPDGTKFYSLEEVSKADAVVLAVPIGAYEEVIKQVIALAPPSTILVDVATIKMYTTGLLKRLAGKRPYIAMHPMFGPESYEKRGQDISGLRIVIAEHTLLPADYAALVEFLKKIGFSVVEMSADLHDKHLAETLFLTHFIGQTISAAGFDRTEIDSVSFGFLMDAVESVRADKKLFQDVYRFNPHCKDILSRFSSAEQKVLNDLARN